MRVIKGGIEMNYFKKRIYNVIILLVVILFHHSALALDNKEALDFFNRYIALTTNFDDSVSLLYSDKAKIHTYRRYPHGLERVADMTGAQWKELMVKAMSLAKQRGDISEYNNVAFSVNGNKIKIKADKYSLLKCYTEKGYYMVIEQDEKKDFKIIEEYMETQPQSDCENAYNEDLQSLLQKTKNQIKNHLPIIVDAETRLDNVKVIKSMFQYQYTLVNYALEELDVVETRSALIPIVKNQACSLPNLKPLIDNGAIISFLYRGKNGKEITTINVTSGQCK